MKVRELIELLQKQDPELIVWAWGCDCVNILSGQIQVDPSDNTLTLDVTSPLEGPH